MEKMEKIDFLSQTLLRWEEAVSAWTNGQR